MPSCRWPFTSRRRPTPASDHWETEGRENDPPYFGWLSTALDYEPATLELKTNLHTRPVGQRPVIELEPTDHPLAVEQRTGITRARVQQLVEQAMHAGN